VKFETPKTGIAHWWSLALRTTSFTQLPQGAMSLKQNARSASVEVLMLDWLLWPADALLNLGGYIASWFASKEMPGFVLIRMMMATFVLAAVVALIVYGQSLVDICRSRWKFRE
jgi:hypothetical protein